MTTLPKIRSLLNSGKIFGAVLLFMFFAFPAIAQKCAKSDKVDEFTKIRTVETDQVRVHGPSVAALAVTGSSDWGYYLFFTMKGSELFFSVNDEGEYHATTSFDSISLILSNDSMLTLRNFRSDGPYERGRFTSEKSHSKIDQKTLDALIQNSITRIRFSYYGGQSVQNDVGMFASDRITKAASCIATYLPPDFATQSTPAATVASPGNNGVPQPTNDTSSVSLYKQWKLVANLDSTGIPTVMFTTFMQFNTNGTYKATVVMKDGKSSVSGGKFLLLNESKIIVLTPDGSAASNSCAITKLTKTELILKTQKYQSIYVAY